jgi:hypothetical protein
MAFRIYSTSDFAPISNNDNTALAEFLKWIAVAVAAFAAQERRCAPGLSPCSLVELSLPRSPAGCWASARAGC